MEPSSDIHRAAECVSRLLSPVASLLAKRLDDAALLVEDTVVGGKVPEVVNSAPKALRLFLVTMRNPIPPLRLDWVTEAYLERSAELFEKAATQVGSILVGLAVVPVEASLVVTGALGCADRDAMWGAVSGALFAAEESARSLAVEPLQAVQSVLRATAKLRPGAW